MNKQFPEIIDIIPQKPPFVMVGAVESCDEIEIVTTFEVESNNVFFNKNHLTEPALIENIAQSAAAQSFLMAGKNGGNPPIGFIGAIDNLKIGYLPCEGEIIRTKVEIVNKVMGATIISGSSFSGDKFCCSCEMKIFIREE